MDGASFTARSGGGVHYASATRLASLRRLRRIRLLVELSWASLGSVLLSSSGNDALGQDLAELDAPLIERVDVPDRALGKDAVLVERDQLAQGGRCQPLHENDI